MNKFLLIETASLSCSAAIADENGILASEQILIPKAHASSLCPIIDNILKRTGLKTQDLSAIAVSEGPGSYTGLRVGLSTAKGLCFGSDVPLIGIGTLDILAEEGKTHIFEKLKKKSIIIPMADARRMEVYTADYNYNAERTSDIVAKVLDEHSFEDEFAEYDSLVFIGDGAEKFKTCLNESKLSKSIFISTYPSAPFMLNPTLKKWEEKKFEDVAYFEPFYLKEFIAGISKKSVL